jgi:UDP-N-acetylglucosamine--N-acetylmuramyl-(pentapeptide) pyrophosphoryl-undecaprenol N-acetylglucosamine transferase
MTNRWLARLATQVLEGVSRQLSAHGSRRAPSATRCAPTSPHLPTPGRASPAASSARGCWCSAAAKGAQRLNAVVPQALALLAPEQPSPGAPSSRRARLEAARAAYSKRRSRRRCLPFIDDMAEAYAWADCGVPRRRHDDRRAAGGRTWARCIVPFALATDDHQTKNAEVMVRSARAHHAGARSDGGAPGEVHRGRSPPIAARHAQDGGGRARGARHRCGLAAGGSVHAAGAAA